MNTIDQNINLDSHSKESDQKIRTIMLKTVPTDGESIGNKALLQGIVASLKKEIPEYNLHPDDFWKIRNQLIEEGILAKARGKGGSVFRLHSLTKKNLPALKVKESDLYKSFFNYIESTWVKLNDIKHFVSEMTACQGKRKTGGKWTRPDIALVAVNTYAYIPGKTIDLITFELKTHANYGIESVFEAAAHSQFAHKSYLAISLPDGIPNTDEFDRIEKECKRFGIGLLIFDDINDLESTEIRIEADRKSPDPNDTNGFITSQFQKDNQHKILEILK